MLTDIEAIMFEMLKAKKEPKTPLTKAKTRKELYADELKEVDKTFMKNRFEKATKKNLLK